MRPLVWVVSSAVGVAIVAACVSPALLGVAGAHDRLQRPDRMSFSRDVGILGTRAEAVVPDSGLEGVEGESHTMTPAEWRARRLLSGPLAFVLTVLVVGSILWKNDLTQRMSSSLRASIDWLIVLLAVVELTTVVALCAYRIARPVSWDFPFFYVPARAAVEGRAFYDPSVLTTVFSEVQSETWVPPDWLQEVSYAYLPPSALILLPLGMLSYRWALLVHYLVQLAFLAGSVVLMHRIAPIRPGRMGLVEMSVLFTTFAPVVKVFSGAQTVLGALFFLLIAINASRRRPLAAGLALGAGFLFKHLLLIPAVMSVSLRRFKIILGFAAFSGASFALSVLAFGMERCRGFIEYGASSRIPLIGFDRVNHSLHATLIRLTGRSEPLHGFGELVFYPPYVLIAGILTLVTVAICLRRGSSWPQLLAKYCLLIALMLIVYPLTLYGTLPLMIPIVVGLFHLRHTLRVPPACAPLFVALVYGFVLFPSGAFWILAALWCGSALATVSLTGRDREDDPITWGDGGEPGISGSNVGGVVVAGPDGC